MKQSSTVRPRAMRPTARRLYFWSRKNPVFWPFSTSTRYLTPFSVISVTADAGTISPGRGYQPLPWASPSFSRRATSFRRKTPRMGKPSARRSPASAGRSRSWIRSMPADSTWTDSRSWNLSTVRPGKASASPKMIRQASRSSGAITLFRYSQAHRSFRCQKAPSNRSLALRDTNRTRILECSDKKPVPRYRPFLLTTSTRPPFSVWPSVPVISAS